MGIGKISRTFIALLFSFLLLSLSTTIASNGYFLNKNLQKKYFVTVELKNDVTNEKIQSFEKELLQNENVKSIKFLGKDQAFLNLQREFEIVIPKAENPLPNSLIVYFEKDENLQAIQELLDVNPMVREVFLDSKFYNEIQNMAKLSQTTMIVGIVLAFFVEYVMVTILRGVIIRDYMLFSVRYPQKKNCFEMARSKNIIQFIASGIIAILLFLNIYVILVAKIQVVFSNVILQSFYQLIPIQLLAYLFVFVLAFKSSGKLRKSGV